MAEDDRPGRGGCGHEGLPTPGPAHPVARQEAHPLPDLRRDGGDGVVVVRLDPEDARRLRRPQPGGLAHPERDRHLPEDVTGPPLADHALHAVDEHDHLHPTLEHAEQCPLVPLVHGVLAGADRDVGRNTTEALAVGRIESREHLEPPDLLRGHHASRRRRRRAQQTAVGALEAPTSAPTT